MAVCSLVAARIAAMEDVLNVIGKLVLYLVTILCGLLIHSLVLLPLVFFVITRSNPYRFMKGVGDALMTAFGIASRFVACICEHMHGYSRGAIHSTKIPTGPTGKSCPPQKVDPFFRNFSGWTEPIHWVLDRNFRKLWLNGSRPRGLYSPRNDTTIRPRNDSVKGIPLF